MRHMDWVGYIDRQLETKNTNGNKYTHTHAHTRAHTQDKFKNMVFPSEN